MAQECVKVLAPLVDNVDALRPQHFIELQRVFTEKGCAAATVNRKTGTLGAMVTHAVNIGLIPYRVAYKRLKEPEGRTRTLSRKEEKRIFEAVGGGGFPVYGLLAKFLLETGLRMREALELNWGNIQEDRIVIKKTKTAKPRVVPLTAAAQAALRPLGGIDDGPFRHIAYDRFIRAWRQAKKELGLEGDSELVPHALRHTCASRLLQSGVDLATVAAWLGDSLDTVQRYVHSDSGALMRARTALEAGV
jgi:integrase